jgi:transcriptional regulator with XRE-family HTH domain
MARAALGWSLDAVAARTGLDRKTILRFEQGQTVPRGMNLKVIRTTFEAAGIRFVDFGEYAGGVVAPLTDP